MKNEVTLNLDKMSPAELRELRSKVEAAIESKLTQTEKNVKFFSQEVNRRIDIILTSLDPVQRYYRATYLRSWLLNKRNIGLEFPSLIRNLGEQDRIKMYEALHAALLKVMKRRGVQLEDLEEVIRRDQAAYDRYVKTF